MGGAHIRRLDLDITTVVDKQTVIDTLKKKRRPRKGRSLARGTCRGNALGAPKPPTAGPKPSSCFESSKGGKSIKAWLFYAGCRYWYPEPPEHGPLGECRAVVPALSDLDPTDETRLDFGPLGSPREVDLAALSIVAQHLSKEHGDG